MRMYSVFHAPFTFSGNRAPFAPYHHASYMPHSLGGGSWLMHTVASAIIHSAVYHALSPLFRSASAFGFAGVIVLAIVAIIVGAGIVRAARRY